MMRPRWAYVLFFLSVMLHLAMAYGVERVHWSHVLGVHGLLWAIFLIQWASIGLGTRQLIGTGLMLRALYLLSVPELSDDVFRYLWDGMLVNQGISPYAFVPSQWQAQGLSEAFGNLIPNINSPDYYSVYPPVLQGIFATSTWLGQGRLLPSVVALRMFVLLAESGSMILVAKLLNRWGMNSRNLMLYALNPLVIVEFAGNLHGEVFMVFFLLLSVRLLAFSGRSLHEGEQMSASNTGKGSGDPWRDSLWFGASAVAFGLSVGTKLLPLMFLPFYIRRSGLWKTVAYGGIALAVVALLFVPFQTSGLLTNIFSSLKLYFANFEFNASIYYLIREVGYRFTGHNIIGLTAVWTPWAVLLIILAMALLDKGRELSTLPKGMLYSWFVYYAFATTVHPWYVTVLAAFLPFVPVRFALVWLITVPLSYCAYADGTFREDPWVLALEYLPVYGCLSFELGLLRPVERWWALQRAEVKRRRLIRFLHEGEHLLEVGVGNGALAKLLGEEGFRVSTLDIADKCLFEDVTVKVYDGKEFPYKEGRFDTVQMITMLHHTVHADRLIGEAMRVADRIIIMEDIYESTLQKYFTWFADSLVNGEFYGHPHTNRTDAQWRALFGRLGLAVEQAEYHRFLLFFKQVTYVLVPDRNRTDV